MASYYISGNAAGGGDGSSGTPWTLAELRTNIKGKGSNNTYYLERGYTSYIDGSYFAVSGASFAYLDISGLTNLTFDVYGTGAKPIIDMMRDLRDVTWTEETGIGTNIWSRPWPAEASGGRNEDRVWFNRVAQPHAKTTLVSPNYPVAIVSEVLYVYSTTEPGASGISGADEPIETLWKTRLFNVSGSNQLFFKNWHVYGFGFIDQDLTANMTQIEFDGIEQSYAAMNRSFIRLEGSASYNLSGFKFENGNLDRSFVQYEDAKDVCGLSDAIRLKNNIGPSSGTTEGAGAIVRDSTFKDWGHTSCYFSMGGSTTTPNMIRINNTLVEDCTFTWTNTNSGRAHAVDGGAANAIFRRATITGQRSPCQWGSQYADIHELLYINGADDLWANGYYQGSPHIDGSRDNDISFSGSTISSTTTDFTATVDGHVLVDGQTIKIENTTNNNGYYTISGVPSATSITVSESFTLESSTGASIRGRTDAYLPTTDEDYDPQRGGAFQILIPSDQASYLSKGAKGNDIYNITIVGQQNAAISYHTGGLNSGSEGGAWENNTITNLYIEDCCTSPLDDSPTGTMVYEQPGSSYASSILNDWVNCLASHSTESLVNRIPNTSSTQTTVPIASLGTGDYAHFDITDGDALLDGTYTPGTGGAAYNAGVSKGSNYDVYSNPRPGAGASSTAPDIGAVEYQDNSGGSIASAPHTYSLRRKIATL